jgi:hypothetical protein
MLVHIRSKNRDVKILTQNPDFEILSPRLWGGTLPLKVVQMPSQASMWSDTCSRVSVLNLKSLSQL